MIFSSLCQDIILPQKHALYILLIWAKRNANSKSVTLKFLTFYGCRSFYAKLIVVETIHELQRRTLLLNFLISFLHKPRLDNFDWSDSQECLTLWHDRPRLHISLHHILRNIIEETRNRNNKRMKTRRPTIFFTSQMNNNSRMMVLRPGYSVTENKCFCMNT